MLRIDTDYIEGLVRDGKKILQVPGKAVLTRKAGVGKRRFRCVACGNYVPQSAHDPDSLYASGVEGLTVRTAIALAALKSWSGLSADIRTAFLHAPLWVSKETTVTFCGIEIQAIEGGFKISQGSYLKELFSRYDIHSSASTPLSSWSEPEIESDATLETVREAQALTGALLWASTKSRPDIAFAVSKLGQYATKSPSIVIQRGRQVLQYLYGTADLWVEYKTSSGSWWLDSPMPRTLTTLELFTDASHAPDGGRSCQAIFICWCNMVLAWESSRQPFTTLSSAESELVAVTSGLVAAESVAAIVEELVSEDVIVSARCDNAAAVRAYAAGNLGWRNRHLRMRAAAGRERIQAGSLVVSFIPGESQVADLATKPLSRPRIMHLLGLLGLRFESKETGG